MSELIAIVYDDPHRAAEVLAQLRRLEHAHLLDLEDAAVAVRDAKGHLRINETSDLTAPGAAIGGLWGLLIGLIFLVPVAGALLGAAIGAITGHYTDIGLDDHFVHQVSEQLQNGTSAIFMLVREVDPALVETELSRFGGRLLRTSLSKDAEDKLKLALAQGRPTLKPSEL